MLLGISTVQLCKSPGSTKEGCSDNNRLDIYHVSFPNDRKLIQAAVYIIFLLDMFQSIVAASVAWRFLVAGWGRRVNFEFPGWTFTALPIVSSLGTCAATSLVFELIIGSDTIWTWVLVVSLGVQTFYAWRVWQIGRWRVAPGIIVFVSLIVSAVFGCVLIFIT